MRKAFLLTFIISLSLIKVSAQSVELSDIRINKTIKANITLDSLRKTGLITSVEPVPETMDIADYDSLIFLGQSHFQYYVSSDQCFAGSIKFDQVVRSLSIKNESINSESTPSDVNKIFDGGCTELYEMNFGKDGVYQTCNIPFTYKGKIVDAALIFFFKDGRLKRIDFWEPS